MNTAVSSLMILLNAFEDQKWLSGSPWQRGEGGVCCWQGHKFRGIRSLTVN
jgi:hypothetical protein